jgi:hypothetical protein
MFFAECLISQNFNMILNPFPTYHVGPAGLEGLLAPQSPFRSWILRTSKKIKGGRWTECVAKLEHAMWCQAMCTRGIQDSAHRQNNRDRAR